MRKFRAKLIQSDGLAKVLGGILALYLALCFYGRRLKSEGREDYVEALAEGPVLLIMWHGSILFAPAAWPKLAPVAVPRDPSPAGRLSAATQEFFGTTPFSIDPMKGDVSTLRQLMRQVKDGYSIALTADGPDGPDHVVKRPAIDWARATGVPIYTFAWSSKWALRLRTWDRMLFPLPFGGGAFVYEKWGYTIPKRLAAKDYPPLQSAIGAALNATEDRAHELANRSKDLSP